MINIKFSDGITKKYKSGITPFEIIEEIDKKLIDKILFIEIDKNQSGFYTNINKDSSLMFYTWKDDIGKKAFWHSSSHLLAQAILNLYPNAKLAIGPPTKNGFYYDVDLDNFFLSKKDFLKVENLIIEYSKKSSKFELFFVSKKKALEIYNNNPYKTEIINNLEDGNITFCRHDNFTDLCRGGHILRTDLIKYVKILNISGVYWRGDKKNKQLMRIYGISFPEKKEFNKYFFYANKHRNIDHRKIGEKLKLFSFSENIGLGLPIWKEKGAILRKILEDFLNKKQKKLGYESVITPHIGKKELYIISGHWDKYKKNSFQSISTPNSKEEFLLKPMNCPHHCEIYKMEKWSYRDLPKRFFEFGTVYRYEKSGELHGLTRTRGFTQDDAHIFCRSNQILEEIQKIIDLILSIFKIFNFKEYKARISLRDTKKLNEYIGLNENWEKAENSIIEAAKNKNLSLDIIYGEAVFYGPKLDFIVKDSLNREWQVGTIQLDYNLPDRFNLNYIGEDNKLHKPIMIHRASFGSLERFIAILIEHTEGSLPFWLSPIQIIIIPINSKHISFSEKILNLLLDYNIRVKIDKRNERINKKIKESEISKIPFMLIIGDKEVSSKTISLRTHKKKNLERYSINSFIDIIKLQLNNY